MPLRLTLVDPHCPSPAGRAVARRSAPRGGGLQLTRAADYAVRALIHLAQQPAATRLSQADIAMAIDAPAPFVGKVMQQLASAGLVTSQRGIGGGFALHADAATVTMLDAVTAIEGPLALNACLSPDEACARMTYCPAHVVWQEVQRRVAEVLQSATIGALAARANETARAAAVPVAPTTGAAPDAEATRDRAPRGGRGHLRADDGLPPRARGREIPGSPGRLRGRGTCHR